MKKISILGVFILALITFNSCETEDDVVFVAQESGELSFTNSFSANYILTPVAADNLAERFTWSSLDFGTPTNITYELQSSILGDFTDVSVVGSTTNNEFAVTIGQMLGFSATAGLDNDANTDAPNTGAISFRLRAFAGDAGLETFSPNSTVTVTLPEGDVAPELPELPKVYVVGNFLGNSGYGANWTPSDAVGIASTDDSSTNYEGFVFMNEASIEYKILPTNTSFDGDYGDDGTFSGTLIQEGESNISQSGAGYYLVRANIGGLTYSAEVTDWAITGNATPAGWPDNGVQDQDMTYNPDSRKWEITIALTAGDNEFKFRANDAWDLNLGDNEGDGLLDFNGGNLSVDEDGTYLVELDLSKGRQYMVTTTLQ